MKKPEDSVIVIFGASGDLTLRKLMPALFDLSLQKLFAKKPMIVGTGRTALSTEAFRQRIAEGISQFSPETKKSAKQLEIFVSGLHYLQLDTAERSDFEKLKKFLKKETTISNILFYLATPPGLFGSIAHHLAKVGLTKEKGGYRRVIVEKPFGSDLASSKELNNSLHEVLTEGQIYRIDHYLGKETVQNLLVTRFANGIFEPLWNRNFIQHIEITAAESLGVEARGGYYDQAGAIRDMVQNHILQMVGLVAMEPPTNADALAIRNEVHKVFQAIRPIHKEQVADQVIRGQYLGSHIRGETIAGYREEKGVAEQSRTETYVAIKFYIDNWRWGGVPFYIRTGKRLPTRVTEIAIHFEPTPHQLFRHNDICRQGNVLVIRIQPDEGILLKFGMKQPGAGFTVNQANMEFHYKDLEKTRVPQAYERLLLDALNGDPTLYARADAVEAAWQFIDPIIQAWNEDSSIPVYGYPAGTWGPENADQLIEGSNQTWRYPCKNLTDDGAHCEL